MVETIDIGEIRVDVVKKDIKNLHLSVYPPNGAVRISAPLRMNIDTIRIYAVSKIGWIKEQQQKFCSQEREPPREYIERESHYLWGQRYLLKVIEENTAPRVELDHKVIFLYVRPGTDEEKKKNVFSEWYRQQLKEAVPPLIAKWEPLMNVKVERFFVQQMKTKWGSCNPEARTIRLNSELAKKPRECLEYVVVHEMAHLLEPSHNDRFVRAMNRFIPNWQHLRDTLNNLPTKQEHWEKEKHSNISQD